VDGSSGFGFELTFRLRREPGETAPPTWPATLLQALARYVFQSGQYSTCHYRLPITIVVHVSYVSRWEGGCSPKPLKLSKECV